MSTALTFHVPPDAHPDIVQAIFRVLTSDGQASLTSAELKQHVAGMLDKQPRGEAVGLLRDLHLVERASQRIALTPLGNAVSASAAVADLIHGLSYIAWTPSEPERLSRMWTYRTVVNLLWELAPATVDPRLKKRLVEEVLGRAEVAFAGTDGFHSARTSIGPKSVDGVVRWLEQLTPAVLSRRHLQRRQRCPPLLMVLALMAAVARSGADIGADFRLGNEQRAFLCRACFLDLPTLDGMLDWTVQTQPQYVRWGTLNARYGRQIAITGRWPA